MALGLLPGTAGTAYADPDGNPNNMTISWTPNEGGTVQHDGRTYTAVPAAGYGFVQWRLTGFSNSEFNPLVVTENPYVANQWIYVYYTIRAVFVASRSVTVTPGSNMAKASGEESQTVTGAMTPAVYTANDGYYFPRDYSVAAVNGIGVTRDSFTQVTVSGTPTTDAAITLVARLPCVRRATSDTHTLTQQELPSRV